MKTPNILIATPAHGGWVKIQTMDSIFMIQNALAARASFKFRHISLSDIALARNLLASAFLGDTTYTHLLFVDADMTFTPDVVAALLDADKPVIGAIYPMRRLNLAKFFESAKTMTMERAIAAASEFAATLNPGATTINHGLLPVRGIGMGLCLIRRDALEIMSVSGIPQSKPGHTAGNSDRLDHILFGFFDHLTAPGGGQLSEDYSFCERWRLCGGEIWGLATDHVGHIGEMEFRANFIDRLHATGQTTAGYSGLR
jgi:hypothetical protein